MQDPLRHCLNQQLITPLSYYFAQYIAEQSGESMDSLLCITAALVSQRNQQGDICIHLNDYADSLAFELELIEGIDNHLLSLPDTKKWIMQLSKHTCVSATFDLQPLIIDGQSLYLGKLWHFEAYIVAQIKQRVEQQPGYNVALLQKGLNTLFGESHASVDWQKIAASIAVTQSFSVISGGPGTGKTTTLVKVLALLIEQNPNINIQLCAPTGKAAIRMLEALNSRKNELSLPQTIINKLPQQAKTIHRLLSYQQGSFRHNESAKLNIDCVVIDEASMIDLELMAHLMKALNDQCRIILLGDKDQLSSVDAGHVFSDICGRGQAIIYSKQYANNLAKLNNITIQSLDTDTKSPLITNAIAILKTSFRFTSDSAIGQLAQSVNNGEGDAALKLLLNHPQELHLIPIAENELPKALIETCLSHYQRVVEAKTIETAFNQFSQFQLLCAVHKGPLGVDALNETITQRLLLRHKISSAELYNGQPILMTQNDYGNKLFNGDIGLLWKIDQHYCVFFQQHDGQLKSFPLISLSHYKIAWAITVHKSQGSEYDEVLLLLPNSSQSSINRELIYTGITRAKNKFSLCSDQHTFVKSCSLKTQRTSNLSKKLGWG